MGVEEGMVGGQGIRWFLWLLELFGFFIVLAFYLISREIIEF